jgi:hypothetical protein
MFTDFFNYITYQFYEILDNIAGVLPKVLYAVLIIFVTWILARMVRYLSIKALRLIGINILSKKTGINKVLEETKIANTLSDLLGLVAYWIILFLGVTYALKIIGFQMAEVLMNEILLYMPKLIVSVLIFVIGTYIADFLGHLCERALAPAHLSYSRAVSLLVKYTIILITLISILEELSVNFEFIRVFLYILIGAIVMIASIVLGVGGIQTGKDFIAGIFIKNHLHQGDILEWKGNAGTIVNISLTLTAVKIDDRTVLIQNSELIKNIIKI